MSLKKLIAFIFQNAGKDSMDENEIYRFLSFRLGWLPPKAGKEVVEKAIDEGLLERDGNMLKPSFDYRSVEIPYDFIFRESDMEKDVVEKVVERILDETGQGEKKIRDEIDEVMRKLEIYREVAALVVAAKKNVDITPFIEEVKDIVKDI
ncbi:MAG: DUF2240 family protein [Thermoplasmata archaeon]|nr:DUF2240 family protein [Thermoplasmata archaeon]